ncbi:MAG TPA: metalloregulator ArsR/SmtB family transcription factor [Verrucomicrobiae bacterium]|nr:metalloregulator ArsR/SmtB family transcription factor [Verrucomicrobiae bacterium]
MSQEIIEAVPASRTHWYPEREDITIYGILAALSDPTRLTIVRQLAEHEEKCPFDFLDIASKQNLTHHFKVLREAGLIMARYEGRQKFVWLRRDLIDPMFPGLLDGVLKAVENT